MEGKVKKRTAKRDSKGFLHLKINLDRVQLELYGKDVQKSLKEINGILDKVTKLPYEAADDMFDYRFDSMLSDELMLNKDIAKLLNNFSQVFRDYRSSRIAIENKKIVELEKGKVYSEMDDREVQVGIRKLLFDLQKDRVKKAVIHVKSAVPEAEARKIIDLVKQELHGADLHPVFSKGDVASHTLIEGIFFGEFQPEMEE